MSPVDHDKALSEAAERLHSIAIRLLRRARVADRESGLGPAQLSALSVLYFAAPMPLSALAEAEQVAQPTMTRTVSGMVAAGVAERSSSPQDRRLQLVTITEAGRLAFEAGRERRLAIVRRVLSRLDARTIAALRPLLDDLAAAVNARD